MLKNIIYPIITAAITAVVGLFLNALGFDFSGLFNSYLADSFLKERIFIVFSLVIILSVIVFDFFRNKLKRTKEKLNIKEKTLTETKKALDDLYEKESKLHAYSALVNFKADNHSFGDTNK